MQQLMDQTQGSFQKNGPDQYISDFFMTDVATSPRYRQDEKTAARIMQIRTDSRGSPVRRTFLGNIESYM